MRHLLVIFLNNNSYQIFYLKPGQEEEHAKQMALNILSREQITEKDIKQMLFINEKEMPPLMYHPFLELNNNKIEINKDKILEVKKQTIRQKRNELLQNLDNEYLIATRRNQKELLKNIEYRSQLLRDIPQKLEQVSFDTSDKIMNFNPFGNVIKIKVIKDEGNYFSFPKIIINPPEGKYGIQATAKTVLENKVIKEIIIEENGCGYDKPPKAIIYNSNTLLETEIDNVINV